MNLNFFVNLSINYDQDIIDENLIFLKLFIMLKLKLNFFNGFNFRDNRY